MEFVDKLSVDDIRFFMTCNVEKTTVVKIMDKY